MNFTTTQVIQRLKALANPDKLLLKEKKFGIISTNALGIYHKDLKVLAKEIGMDSELASELFDTGIYEARILCSKIFKKEDLTNKLLEKWVASFENWEICDSFCMGLVAKSKWAVPKILEWVDRKREFEKRAGFTTIAAYCMADKKADNAIYEQFFPIIKNASTDERLYVKKAVNWALRNIGKRNIDLNKQAIIIAKEILTLDTKSAKWIAKDALRELEKEGINILDYPRTIYRPELD